MKKVVLGVLMFGLFSVASAQSTITNRLAALANQPTDLSLSTLPDERVIPTSEVLEKDHKNREVIQTYLLQTGATVELKNNVEIVFALDPEGKKMNVCSLIELYRLINMFAAQQAKGFVFSYYTAKAHLPTDFLKTVEKYTKIYGDKTGQIHIKYAYILVTDLLEKSEFEFFPRLQSKAPSNNKK